MLGGGTLSYKTWCLWDPVAMGPPSYVSGCYHVGLAAIDEGVSSCVCETWCLFDRCFVMHCNSSCDLVGLRGCVWL